MIKNVKIRILAFFMAVTLSFCVCSNEYYEVKALEWAVPVIGLDTALKALLGLLGVTASAGLISQIDWSDVRDDAVNYQIQKGNDAVAVGRWWDKVISGGLDTASSCWTSFKEWVTNELLASGGSGGSGAVTLTGTNTELIHSIFPDAYGFAQYPETYTCGLYSISSSNPSRYRFTLFQEGFSLYTLNDGTIVYRASSSKYINLVTIDSSNFQVVSDSRSTNNYWGTAVSSSMDYYFLNSGYTESELQALNSKFHLWDGTSVSPGESEFDSAVSDLGVIGLAPDVATDLPYDGVIDIPWENVGATDTAIDDAFDDAIDKVNTGAWTLDQYWSWVQNVTNVFAYDTTNNYLLPNDGDDEKADDKIQENINRGAMVLYGLEKVFPFCIPWDIYAFVNLLVADPVAPVIEYPIYNPVSGEHETIIIDFSVWESQVILMRYIQDFLLIIGLLLLARSLIGAGGSD